MKIFQLLFLILCLAFPVLAAELDPEDPQRFEHFKGSYPQNCPECMGQISGECTAIPFSTIVLMFVPSTMCCLVGFLSNNVLLFSCCGINSSAAIAHGMGHCCYKYAERSRRNNLVDRADFARTCSSDDPLSVFSCFASLKDGYCIPVRNFGYEIGSGIYQCCANTKSNLTKLVTPPITWISNGIWNYCLADCLNLFCGAVQSKDS